MPRRLDWGTLENKGKHINNCVQDLPCDCDFHYDAKIWSWEDAEVEEEDGEFGKILDKDVDNSGDEVELHFVS